MNRTGYSIGGKYFRTKSDIIKECQRICNSVLDGELIRNDDDIIFLNELFKYSPAYKVKFPNEYKTRKIWVNTNTGENQGKTFKTRCFYFETIDNKIYDISFYACIKNIPTSIQNSDAKIRKRLEQDVKKAFRNAVDSDLIEFKRNIHYPAYSKLSGTIINSYEEADVDHYDLTFEDLITSFMSEKGYSYEYLYKKTNMNEVAALSTVTRFLDKELINEFREYHKKNTHLRLVLKKENKSLLRKKNSKK